LNFPLLISKELEMISRAAILCLTWTNVCLLNSPVFGQEDCQAKAPPTLKRIDAAMQEFVDADAISGAVTLVAHDGKIVHLGATGMASLAANKTMQPSSLFSIASMTKPIVASAVMILQDDGKLNVDDKVSDHLPAFASLKLLSGDAVNREITIRDALTHTSGLAGSQLFSGSLAAAADELAKRPLAFQPGTKWQYSPGLNVAGRIVEVVSELPLEEFLRQRIFKPLGMTNTTFTPNEEQQSRIATIYAPGEDNRSLMATDNHITDFSNVKGPNPSGGLVSSARDMFRFYQMVLNKGRFHDQRILSSEAVEQMTSPQTGSLETGFTPGNCWGLGWCIVLEPQGVTGMLSPGSFGHGGAFGTQGWVDPRTKTIYVLMIQRTKFGNSDASDIRQRFQQLANESLGL
jgi:CubicO group peptidase (beta-lactamase class C family)